jgi:hypothetical protein
VVLDEPNVEGDEALTQAILGARRGRRSWSWWRTGRARCRGSITCSHSMGPAAKLGPKDEVLAKLLQRLGEVRLVPGMPVEACIETADRTVGSYLVKPLLD